MAAFEYRASDRSGSVQRGVESAADLQSAARALRARGLTPIVLKPAGSSALYAVLSDPRPAADQSQTTCVSESTLAWCT